MKLSQLLDGISVKFFADALDPEITSVEMDSRKVKPGSLFICLRGLTVDGHDFIEKAVDKGAAAVLVESSHVEFPKLNSSALGFPKNLSLAHTDNTRAAMAAIAANFYHHPARALKLIGVTGTNGKTTTTHFIEEMLRLCGYSTGLIGSEGIWVNGENQNIEFATSTTPDPLELHLIFANMLSKGVQYVVMEVSSHALHFHKMEGLQFDVGVFTNLTQDHLDLHGTMENYKLAKAQLFKQSSFAVVNIDDEATPTMLEFHGDDPFLTFGADREADLKAENIICTLEGSEFSLKGISDKIKISPIARFNVYNTLAAIGTAKGLGLTMEAILPVISSIKGVPGRVQPVPNNKGFGVYVDYSHTPDSLANILTTVREFTTGQLIAIMGCGGDRDKEKRPIMGRIAGDLSDFCIITSDNPRTEDPMTIIYEVEAGVIETKTEYIICENRRDAIYKGVNKLKPGDTLVIAGKGNENYQIIGTVKFDFSDYQIALEAINGVKY